MNNLYNKIYEAVDTGIQKALIISDDQSQDTSVKFNNKEISSEFAPYEYRTVDLGLPSGLLWCEYNLGAYPGDNSDDWHGDYYAWGSISRKDDYSQDSIQKYILYDSINRTYTKYNGNDYKTQLEPEDDAATISYSKLYHIPTKDDYDELLENTFQKWVTNYQDIANLHGMMFTSKNNGKSIFMPATSIDQDDSIEIIQAINTNGVWYMPGKTDKNGNTMIPAVLKKGIYWTATADQFNHNHAYQFYFNCNGADIQFYNRYNSYAIRAVKKP